MRKTEKISKIQSVEVVVGDRGANINVIGGEFGTAFAAAAASKQKDLMLLLLGRGAHTNIVIGKFGSVLGESPGLALVLSTCHMQVLTK